MNKISTHKRKAGLTGQVILGFFLAVIAVAIIVPFLLIVAVSISNEKDVLLEGYKLIPQKIDLSAYKFVLSNPGQILQAYKITFIFSCVGTFLTTLFTALLAYPLSRQDMVGRKFINLMLFFTMLFSGGLVPTYLLNTKYLNLDDTILVYIIPSLLSVWHVFMMRTFFSQLPNGLVEAAMLDGASQYKIFFSIAIPLSKPVIATVAVLTFLGKWNSWYETLLYVSKPELYSLQYFLQKMMREIQLVKEMSEQGVSMSGISEVPSETARMAMAVLVSGPVLFVFPFFQKYFVKGLTVGGVKG